MQAAYDTYGVESFQHEIIEEVCEDNVQEREQYWIDTISLDRRFNIKAKAGKMSAQTRLNIGVGYHKRCNLGAYMIMPKQVKKQAA